MDTASPYGQILVSRSPSQPLSLTRTARDPRFDWLAPVDSVTVDSLGSGLGRRVTRSVVVSGNTLQESVGLNTVAGSPRYVSSYDSVARIMSTRTPAGRTTRVVLDGVGRPTSTSIPGLLPVTLTYDPLGKLTLLERNRRLTPVLSGCVKAAPMICWSRAWRRSAYYPLTGRGRLGRY
jgi:hypothetical protein